MGAHESDDMAGRWRMSTTRQAQRTSFVPNAGGETRMVLGLNSRTYVARQPCSLRPRADTTTLQFAEAVACRDLVGFPVIPGRGCRSSVHGLLERTGPHVEHLAGALGAVAGGGVRRERQPRYSAAPALGGRGRHSPNGVEAYAGRGAFERSIAADLGSDTTSTGNCRGQRVLS